MIQTKLQRTQRATLSNTIFKPACNILSLNATVPRFWHLQGAYKEFTFSPRQEVPAQISQWMSKHKEVKVATTEKCHSFVSSTFNKCW